MQQKMERGERVGRGGGGDGVCPLGIHLGVMWDGGGGETGETRWTLSLPPPGDYLALSLSPEVPK